MPIISFKLRRKIFHVFMHVSDADKEQILLSLHDLANIPFRGGTTDIYSYFHLVIEFWL